MITSDRQREWTVEYETRLGDGCDDATARRMADEHIAAIEAQDWSDQQQTP